MEKPARIYINVPVRHNWIVNISNKAAVIEFLLDEMFGDEWSDDPVKQRELLGERFVKSQEILKKPKPKKGPPDDEN